MAVNWDYDPGWKAEGAQEVDWGYDSQWEPPKPSIARRAGDVALEAVAGATGGIKAVSDAFGAGSRVSQVADEATRELQSYQSPARQLERQRHAQRTQEAEASGSALREAGAAVRNFVEAPVSSIASAFGSSAPTLVATAANPALGVTVGAMQGAGAVKGSVHDDVRRRHTEAGMDPIEAGRLAREAQAYGGPNTDQIVLGGGLGAVAGRFGAEGVLAGRAAQSGGTLARAVRAAVVEGATEAVQGGQERLAGNIASQRAGFADVPTWQGVAGQATFEALAGAGVGASMSLAAGRPDAPADQPGADMLSPVQRDRLDALDRRATTAPESLSQAERAEREFLRSGATPSVEHAAPASPDSPGRMDPQPAAPASVQMGLDPSAGPLSAAAATAMDSGVVPAPPATAAGAEVAAIPGDALASIDRAAGPNDRPAIDRVPPTADQFDHGVPRDFGEFAPMVPDQSPISLENAQRLVDLLRNQGGDFAVVPTTDGQGFGFAPAESLSAAQREAVSPFQPALPVEDVRAAQPSAPQVEPSAPNELDAASMGIRERQPPATPEPIEAVGDRWDTLAPAQRAAMLNEAGGWNARNGSLNVIGKNLAGKEWSRIPEGVRSKVTQLLQAAPRADAVVPAAQPQGVYDGAIPTDDMPDAALAAPGAAQAGDYMGPSAGAASQQFDVPAAGGMEPAAASVVGGRVPGESAGVESAGRAAVAPGDGSPAGQALRILIERTDGNGSPDGLAGPENADARTAIVAAITGQSIAEIEAAPNYKFRTSVPQVERLLYDAAGIPAGNLKDRRAPFLDWLDAQTGQQAPQAESWADGAASDVVETDAIVDALSQDEAAAVAQRLGKRPVAGVRSAYDLIKTEHPDDIRRAVAGDQWDGRQWISAREGQGPQFSRAGQNADEFVQAPDGSIDFGEITAEMASTMRRQAGKIRLQQGEQNADGTGWGLAHIEARHGREIRSAGFEGAEAFVSDAVRHINAVWRPGGKSQLVAVQAGSRGKVVFLELQPARDEGGDFYRVNSAFPAPDNYVERKRRKEGWERLWSRYPVSADASGTPGFAGQSPDAGETAPTVSPQSETSISPTPAPIKSDKPANSLAARVDDDTGFTELARSYRARGITPDTLREAIAGQFPSLSRGLERMLERGQKGEKGGLVVIDSTHERDIAEVFAQKTRRPLDEVVRYFSDAKGENPRGLYDSRSGITFMVGPNLTAQSAPAVLLHEMVHSQQRANIDARSMAMIEGRGKNVVRPMRELLNRVADRMARAGESGNASEATAYIVEEAVLLGRQAGFSVVDGPFMDFVDARISRRIGDILRDVVAMVRAWSLRHGAGIVRLTVDDLVAYAKAGVDLAGRGEVQTKTEGGTRASTSGDALLARKVEAVNLHLRGWSGTREQLRALASGWYSDNLQGRSFKNADMDVDVLFTSEGKGTAFATSGNLRVGWRAEMVRALPDLISRAVKVAESKPDARRTKDTRAFHTLLSPLVVNNKPYTAKITVREALAGPVPRHKFYDVAALEIESGPEVSGLKDPGINTLGPLPTPSEPRSFTVGELAAAVNGLDLAGDAPQFSRAGRGIDAAPTVDIGASPEKMAMSDWLSHQLKNARGWAMGALTRDQIADLFGREMPQVRRFDEVVQNMDATRQTISQEADVLIERWRQLPGPLADRLADLMHQATIRQFDPDTAKAPANAIQVEIQQQWNALPVPVQNLYREVRDSYTRTLGAIRDSLADRAERASSTGAQVAAKIRLEFDRHLTKGPYFPLARFGDLMLIAKKDGDTRVETFESSFRREQRKRMLEINGWTVKQTRRQEYAASRDGSASEFVSKVIEKIDSTNMPMDQKASLLDGLNQMAISLLPSASYRQHFAHRKGTQGFSTDAMRAFASSMQHAAHHIARIRHAHELSILLDEMQKGIREAGGGIDVTLKQEVVNELTRRLDYLLKPNTHPVAAAAGQVGFVMSLGGSVAAGLVNLTQTPMVTLPWLGSKHGFTKAAEAITKASKDYFSGKWEKWSGFVLTSSPNLNLDEKAAIQQLEASGLISLTQSSDLAGTANTDSTVSQRAWAINRAMKVVGWTFHVPEVFNRQVSALAAYRLAREAGRDHAAAVEEARITLIRTHFDYSASNRARWMQGNFTRVITMFKQYSQQMTYLLWRNAYQALKGESPEVKREARRMLVGVGAMHFAAAGSLGLPLGVFGISPLLSLLAMGMGDEDDPYDWETEYRNMLADTFGQDMGEAIAKGPLRMLLNVDFASRVGLGDLWIRPPSKEAEGRDLVEAWMLTLLGPVAGYVGQMGTAAKAFDEGKYARGVESMVPKFIASPLKAARFEQEGVRSWRGDDLGIDLTPADIFGVALGFQPSRMAEMYEGRAAVKGRESRLQGRRQEILNMWVAAYMAGDQFGQMDAVQAAQRFGEKNPAFAITGAAFRQAYRSKMRNAAQIRDGIHLSPKRDSLRDEGRFANVQ